MEIMDDSILLQDIQDSLKSGPFTIVNALWRMNAICVQPSTVT